LKSSDGNSHNPDHNPPSGRRLTNNRSLHTSNPTAMEHLAGWALGLETGICSPAMLPTTQEDIKGQIAHFGARDRHRLLPKSIPAWLKSPGRFTQRSMSASP
jgi:hypothetical protein